MKTVLILIAILTLAGCASGPPTPPTGRDKYGGSQEEFATTRYQCLRESSVRVSSGVVNQQGGAYTSGAKCNLNMYDACMESKGWFNQPGGRFRQASGCE